MSGGGDWSDAENDLIVGDYFDMLADDLAGALVGGDLPDGVTAQQVAEGLHDLLRPYI